MCTEIEAAEAETGAVATILSIGRGWLAKERFICLVGAGAVWVAYGAYYGKSTLYFDSFFRIKV